MALVVDRFGPKAGMREVLGIGRLIKLQGTSEAEFAILIADKWQHHGIGTELLRRLIQIGQQEGVKRITADILPDNRGMLRVCERLGFQLKHSRDEEVVKASIQVR